MAYQIVWSASASERIGEILDFIAEDNPAAARQVVQRLLDRIEALTDLPRLGRPLVDDVEPDLRRLVVGDYVVIYRVDEARQTVFVSAIRHFRQRSLRGEEV